MCRGSRIVGSARAQRRVPRRASSRDRVLKPASRGARARYRTTGRDQTCRVAGIGTPRRDELSRVNVFALATERAMPTNDGIRAGARRGARTDAAPFAIPEVGPEHLESVSEFFDSGVLTRCAPAPRWSQRGVQDESGSERAIDDRDMQANTHRARACALYKRSGRRFTSTAAHRRLRANPC